MEHGVSADAMLYCGVHAAQQHVLPHHMAQLSNTAQHSTAG